MTLKLHWLRVNTDKINVRNNINNVKNLLKQWFKYQEISTKMFFSFLIWYHRIVMEILKRPFKMNKIWPSILA